MKWIVEEHAVACDDCEANPKPDAWCKLPVCPLVPYKMILFPNGEKMVLLPNGVDGPWGRVPDFKRDVT